jgi:hypothetical protein
MRPRGATTYIVTGAGGADLYPRRARRTMTAAYRNDMHSFTRITVNGLTLRGEQIGENGAILDRWTLKKQPRSVTVRD